MTQYAVCAEWEHNGRDDSDWYRVVFDPESGTLERVLTHTTRGCMNKARCPHGLVGACLDCAADEQDRRDCERELRDEARRDERTDDERGIY